MISNNESYRTLILESFYVILPEIKINKDYSYYGNTFMEDNSEYSSGKNILINETNLKNIIKNECL